MNMEKVCEKCGAALDEKGICPNCAEAAAEDNTPETKEVKKEVKEEAAQEAKKTAPNDEPQESRTVAAQAESDENSKFTLTAKQTLNVIKGFFSRNAVDTIASQYSDEVPIWSILLPVYVVISAISATATYNSRGYYDSQITAMLKGVNFGAGEVFFLNLALALITMFVMSFAVRIFIKMHKGDGHFNMSANLVTAAQLPVMMIGLFNVITGGVISGVLASADVLVDCASYMLIFAGISKALGGKKPIWSFFLMIICATAAAVVITVFVASPVIFSRVAYSLMDSFNVK
jgi:uncharacterized Zn finger protein (UPF0148 family)